MHLKYKFFKHYIMKFLFVYAVCFALVAVPESKSYEDGFDEIIVISDLREKNISTAHSGYHKGPNSNEIQPFIRRKGVNFCQ